MKKRIVINGRVFLCPTNGITRYATEITKYIDENLPQNIKMDVVVPEGYTPKFKLKFGEYIQLKNFFAWDFTQAERYARSQNALYLNFASKGVLYKNSITTIHDIRIISFDPKPSNFRELATYIKFNLSFFLAVRNAKKIVTVSKFCKDEIINNSNCSENKIHIIGNGWNHIIAIEPDKTIFHDFPDIKTGNYYISIGSIAPHKNFKWIVKNAAINPDSQYVIIGNTYPKIWAESTNEFHNNIVYVGYQSDERMKSLLLNAKALIFPSLFEGFGIPPIEAAGCGIPTIVSDIPVMREIMNNHTLYIDPKNAELELDELLQTFRNDRTEWLSEYTWESQGRKWIDLILHELSLK